MRFALIALSCLVALLLGECAMRVARPNPYRHERPDWMTWVRLQHAGKDLPVDRSAIDPNSPTVYLRADARGYLEPSRRFERPDATIAFLGGSTTECAALAEDERWPARVSAGLEARGLRVNALNAGVSGNTTHDAVNVLLNHVVYDRPDVAVLMEAVNDFGLRDYRAREAEPMTASLPARWALQSLSSHSALVGALRQLLSVQALERGEFRRPARRVEERVPTREFERRLRAFVGICRAFDVVPVLMTQPFAATRTAFTPEWTDATDQERFNEAIRKVAREERVELIDLVRHLERDVPGWDRPMHVFYDGLHVTAEGARIYAEHVTERLRASVPLLRR
jgi:lysophospholipase L1-like esterase